MTNKNNLDLISVGKCMVTINIPGYNPDTDDFQEFYNAILKSGVLNHSCFRQKPVSHLVVNCCAQ